MNPDRHHRQTLLRQIGRDGHSRLAASHALILGVGALGSAVAEHLARAGVGRLTIVDRDVVELTNLQRQSLYAERDVGLPKVEAAARRLRAIDASLRIEPVVRDVDSGSIGTLPDADVIVDGSDNAELRYLVNDFCVARGRAWVMGGVIGTEGRVAGFDPRRGPCLRCVFRTPPAPGELATCDTAGVLGPAVGVVGSLQAVEAMKLLLQGTAEAAAERQAEMPVPQNGFGAAARALHVVDVWTPRFATIDLHDARRADCPCCGGRTFEFLDRPATGGARLCGRNAVQVRPPSPTRLDLDALAARWAGLAEVERTELMVRLTLPDRPGVTLSVFGDGRMLASGTEDVVAARALYARVVGG